MLSPKHSFLKPFSSVDIFSAESVDFCGYLKLETFEYTDIVKLGLGCKKKNR